MKNPIRNIICGVALTLCGLVTSNAMAEVTIAINSFVKIGDPQDVFLNMGEVCGTVKGASDKVFYLKIMSDYNTHNPGEYHTFTGPSGNFCQVIRTLAGSVQVTALLPSIDAKAVATLTHGK